MPRKQVGFQNPDYTMHYFIFNYAYKDDDNIKVGQYKCKFSSESEYLKNVECPQHNYKDVLLPVATARFLQKHMDKVILDYKVDECLETSSKRYNSSARGIKIYIQDILGDKTHL